MVSAVPLALIELFFPWEIPQLHFFFIGILIVIKIIFFQDGQYKKNIKTHARGELQKKIGRVPSDSEIIDYVEKKITGRSVSFAVAFILTFSTFILIG
jgi:hypothetical protein